MRKKYEKHSKPKRAGTIKLFFDDNLISCLRFQHPLRRKVIIEQWEQQYRIKKLNKQVYYQISYDEI